MPSTYQWVTFTEWGTRWGLLTLPNHCDIEADVLAGDIIYTTIFGSPVLVLNSIEAARDLLDKRGSNYSDRARAVVHNEM